MIYFTNNLYPTHSHSLSLTHKHTHTLSHSFSSFINYCKYLAWRLVNFEGGTGQGQFIVCFFLFSFLSLIKYPSYYMPKKFWPFIYSTKSVRRSNTDVNHFFSLFKSIADQQSSISIIFLFKYKIFSIVFGTYFTCTVFYVKCRLLI